MVEGRYVFGPGKSDILAAIAETGSLAGAARILGMSYMRAWVLVQDMHKTFAQPLVILQRGGKTQGGATLTPAGEKAIALYHQMEAEALASTEKTWKAFCGLLRGA